MRRFVIAAGLAMLVSGNGAIAKCGVAKPPGTFSSLSQHASTGDITGMELRIVMGAVSRSRRRYQATFQMAEGGPGSVSLEDVTFDDCRFAIRMASPRADEVVAMDWD